MKKAVIYALKEDDCIRYIGKTCHPISCRLSAHLKNARNGDVSHRSNWIRKMLSQGKLPTITIIETTNGDGCKEEIKWIKFFRTYSGVKLTNMSDGGDGFSPGHKVSDKLKEKLRALRLGSHLSAKIRRAIGMSLKGKRKGIPFTEEHRRALCAGRKGMKLSKTHREAIGKAGLGRTVSLTTRKKLSLKLKGRIVTEKTRIKIKNTLLGRHVPSKVREKIRAAMKGRVITWGDKISAANKGRNLRNTRNPS